MAMIDWNEISKRGLLVRINREIMHPLGLAICRTVETGESAGALVSSDGAWRYPDDKHCAACNSYRRGDTCWKCGADTHEPGPSWTYPELPPVDKIRELAREVGYAIGEHGSKERDLDLMALPWSEDAVPAHNLLHHIAQGLGGSVHSVEAKPHGRLAATLVMSGWFRPIDLSVCPPTI